MEATTPMGSRRIMEVWPGRYSPAERPLHGAHRAREEAEAVHEAGISSLSAA
jgi:hypothetical protein